MLLQEFCHDTVLVPQVTIYPRASGAVLNAGRIHALFNPVEAKGTFVNDLFFGMNVAAAVRAGLYTVTASYAVRVINEDDALRTVIGCTYRAYLYAGRLMTMVTEFRHKERFEDLIVGDLLLETVDTPVRGFNMDISVGVDGILLDPCPEIIGLVGHTVFFLAGIGTAAAANTFFYVDTITIPGAFGFRLFTGNNYGIER